MAARHARDYVTYEQPGQSEHELMPDHVRQTGPRVLLSDVQARPGATGKILRGTVVHALPGSAHEASLGGPANLGPLENRTHNWGAGVTN
jgi:hypothetical protein